MRPLLLAPLAPLFLFGSFALASGCSGKVVTGATPDSGTNNPPPPPDGADGGSGEAGTATHHVTLDKVDLLFMIDNSASMGDKQDLLRQVVPDLVSSLVSPSCVDASGNVLGTAVNGVCANGSPAFPAVHDIHIGVVSSSLGGRGSDTCPPDAKNPANPSLSTHNDDQGHLLVRAGADEHPLKDAAGGFLAFAPGGDINALVADFQDMVDGIGQYGCGFEAQLESWYRFLVQPDPYAAIDKPAQQAKLLGVDATILQQRHDFLRPDSLVAIVLLTDENDSTVDPLSLGGQGWAYENTTFPGSKTGGGAARGTSICAVNPMDPSCTSCGFGQTPSDPSCQQNGGYYNAQTEDPLNLRFFQMKRRFGVDPQFPVSRYVNGLTSQRVPDRDGEHPMGAANYVGKDNCVSPLFATHLPDGSAAGNADALCNLERGPRVPAQVIYAVIGGVPQSLLHFDPKSAESGKLSADDWTAILGKDPLSYDFTGADPHMLESDKPRAGLAPPSASDTADPIHGRERDTQGQDLQYACTFALPAPKDCTQPQNVNACDCGSFAHPPSPLCDPTTATMQIRGKAFPTIRELSVARALGDRGVAASVCPTSLDVTSPMFGYRPAVKAIIDRVGGVLRSGVDAPGR